MCRCCCGGEERQEIEQVFMHFSIVGCYRLGQRFSGGDAVFKEVELTGL